MRLPTSPECPGQPPQMEGSASAREGHSTGSSWGQERADRLQARQSLEPGVWPVLPLPGPGSNTQPSRSPGTLREQLNLFGGHGLMVRLQEVCHPTCSGPCLSLHLPEPGPEKLQGPKLSPKHLFIALLSLAPEWAPRAPPQEARPRASPAPLAGLSSHWAGELSAGVISLGR